MDSADSASSKREWDYLEALPPSLNQIIGSRGKAMRGWRAKQEWEMLVRAAMAVASCPAALEPRTILLRYYFPTQHKRDPDNYQKVVLDACVRAGLLIDDNPHTCRVQVEIAHDPDAPRTEIYVREGI